MSRLSKTLNKSERNLLRRIEKTALEFYELSDGPTINANLVGKNLQEMASHLELLAQTRNPAAILSGEVTILTVDMMKLEQVVDKETSVGKKVSPEIKADLTSLDDGLRQIGRATRVFTLRAQYGEDAYHDISVGSRGEKDVDAHGTANDVLRQSCKSHGVRLQNMARGVSRTELDRKTQVVIGRRRHNIAACEDLYKAHQRDFVKNRNTNRASS